MDFSGVYELLDSESVGTNGPLSSDPLDKIDEYLHDVISIIENDNPVSLSDIKLLVNAARYEVENLKSKK